MYWDAILKFFWDHNKPKYLLIFRIVFILQIFENTRLDSENGSNDNVDAEDIRRLTMNRSSIAERRRLYESRAMTEEKPPQSPLPTL